MPTSLRQILTEEGLRTAGSELEARFELALQALLKEADLPSGVRFKGVKSQSATVSVPPGFGSLFLKIEVDLEVEHAKGGIWGRLRWSYKHPSGSNGIMIGTIYADGEDLRAGWRMEDGRRGEIAPPK